MLNKKKTNKNKTNVLLDVYNKISKLKTDFKRVATGGCEVTMARTFFMVSQRSNSISKSTDLYLSLKVYCTASRRGSG